jgi:hypothetical protein
MPLMPISLAIALVINLFALRLFAGGPPGMLAANRESERASPSGNETARLEFV